VTPSIFNHESFQEREDRLRKKRAAEQLKKHRASCDKNRKKRKSKR
jgi:hypothetical protein